MRKKEKERARAYYMDFISETRIEVNRVENKFHLISGRVMGTMVDHFDKMVRNIRCMLDSLHKILQQKPAAALHVGGMLGVRIVWGFHKGESTHDPQLVWRYYDLCRRAQAGESCISTSCKMPYVNAVRQVEEDLYFILSRLDEEVSKGIKLDSWVDMIFRPEELELIATWLVDDSSPYCKVSCFPIIGMPASGKSSFAYLLFHHPKVTHHFQQLRIWINWKQFSAADTVEYISKVVSINTSYNYNSREPHLLIVIDDFLIEDGREWSDLLQPFLSGFSGVCTKLLITSTSSYIPRLFLHLPLANKDLPYLLGPLPHDKFLPFFQTIAFKRIADQDTTTHLRNISIEIFNKFTNADFPVLRIIASILSAQPPSEWHYFNEIVLNIPNPEKYILTLQDQIMQYPEIFDCHLLFPLGYEFSNLDFYHLWDAHEEQFPQLLKDKFEMLLGNELLFECCKRDKSGVIVKYKVQVLAYEVAKLLTRNKHKNNLVEKYTHDTEFHRPFHLSIIVDSSWKLYSSTFHRHEMLCNLKSFLLLPTKSCGFITLPAISDLCPTLRVLDVANNVNCKNSMESMVKLKELRYLRLGVSPESLPECITDLYHLQTLDLRHSRVRKLPANFHELQNLRHLYVGDRLIDLPPRFGELTKLETLDVFTVGQHNGLDDLENFTELVGKLSICYREGRQAHGIPEYAIILQDQKLHELSLEWPEAAAENYQKEDAMEFELLQPPSTLKILTIKNWNGERFPKWAMDRFSSLLSNLVFIHISDCNRCRHLPSFGRLGCLESLELWGLIALEWIEIYDDNSMVSSETPYFPALEQVSLHNLPMLKRWSRPSLSVIDDQHISLPILPRLSGLRVSCCLELISMPLMPNLQTLETNNCHGNFLQQFISAHALSVPMSFSSPAEPLLQRFRSLNLTNISIPERLDCLTTLKELSLCWLYDLRVLPDSIGHLTQLCRLVVRHVPNLVDLPDSLAGLSALENVEIQYCPRLKHIPRFVPDLKSLQLLKIKDCVNLERRCQEPDGEDWPLIQLIPKVQLG